MSGTCVCLHCDGRHDPYESGHLMYCSDECAANFNKKRYKFKRFWTESVPNWLFWKPYFYIVDWIYEFECPYCNETMYHMGNLKDPHWLMCLECMRTFEYTKVKKSDDTKADRTTLETI